MGLCGASYKSLSLRTLLVGLFVGGGGVPEPKKGPREAKKGQKGSPKGGAQKPGVPGWAVGPVGNNKHTLL